MSGLPEGDGERAAKAPDPVDFKVTHSAWLGIEDVREHQGGVAGVKGLRIAVKGGGCSGLSYLLDWADRQPTDIVLVGPTPPFNCVYIEKRSMLFLKGSELEQVRTSISHHFEIRNPNAKSTCGCGESFSV